MVRRKSLPHHFLFDQTCRARLAMFSFWQIRPRMGRPNWETGRVQIQRTHRDSLSKHDIGKQATDVSPQANSRPRHSRSRGEPADYRRLPSSSLNPTRPLADPRPMRRHQAASTVLPGDNQRRMAGTTASHRPLRAVWEQAGTALEPTIWRDRPRTDIAQPRTSDVEPPKLRRPPTPRLRRRPTAGLKCIRCIRYTASICPELTRLDHMAKQETIVFHVFQCPDLDSNQEPTD